MLRSITVELYATFLTGLLLVICTTAGAWAVFIGTVAKLPT